MWTFLKIGLNLIKNIPKLNSLVLAGPNFSQSHEIDILLSTLFLFEILESGEYIIDNFVFQNSKREKIIVWKSVKKIKYNVWKRKSLKK